jgi:hypothetical protein
LDLEVGKTYKLRHTRKGEFTAKVLSCDDEWAEVEIVEGEAKEMSRENEGPGEKVTIRVAHVFKAVEVS